jgi:hypothetical protein
MIITTPRRKSINSILFELTITCGKENAAGPGGIAGEKIFFMVLLNISPIGN